MKRGIEDLQLQIAAKRAGVENMARAGAPRRGFRIHEGCERESLVS